MPIDIYNDPHAEKRGDILRKAIVDTFAQPPVATVQPGRALYLTADARVVEEGDTDAELLLVGAQGVLPKTLADELGIEHHKPTQEEIDKREAAEHPEEAEQRASAEAILSEAHTPEHMAEHPEEEKIKSPPELTEETTHLPGTTVSFGGKKGK
jgi:hypothetical protein